MKNLVRILLIAIFSITIVSCGTTVYKTNHPQKKSKVYKPKHKKHAPGQVKKVYGSKSAKKYAPGQQKKKHHKIGKKSSKHQKRDIPGARKR